jgi:hypothetical protein
MIKMKAKFEIKQMLSDWKPPFQKQINTESFWVEEGEYFDLNGENAAPMKAFKLIKCENGKALIEYHGEFLLKGYEHPQNRQIWLYNNNTATISAQWQDKGISKTAKLIEISTE